MSGRKYGYRSRRSISHKWICNPPLRRKCTKRPLLSLIGSLSIAWLVVVPRRTFLSCLINLSCTLTKLDRWIYLFQQVKEDVNLWRNILTQCNGANIFLSHRYIATTQLNFETDVSSTIGFYKGLGSRKNEKTCTIQAGTCPLRSYSLSWFQQLYGDKFDRVNG